MNSRKINITLALVILTLGLTVFLLFDKYTGEKKIAYVRSTELVYGYLGMKEAGSKFQEKTQMWQANVDTLQRDYQSTLSAFTSEAARLSEKERMEREQYLAQQQQSLMQYTQAINSKMQEEDKKMTEGVLNQVNSFVEQYGKDHGYEIILGTTLSGSLLYGDNAIDITDEVLAALNKTYQGESK